MFVVRIKSTQEYLAIGATWRNPRSTDLQEARTFARRADAANAGNSYYRRIEGDDYEVLPVRLELS